LYGRGGQIKLGQLGNETTVKSNVPVKVAKLTEVVALAKNSESNTMYAIKSGGTVWGWGQGLGDVPVEIKGLSTVVAIANSAFDTEALKANGTVWSWGENEYGSLGNGTDVASSTPVEAVGVVGATGVAVAGWSEAATSLVENPAGLLYPNQVGGHNPSGPCWCGHGSAGDPVDTATGEFSESYTDMQIPGRGVPLNFGRSYSSGAAAVNGPLGYGWHYSYGMSLSASESGAVVTQENGSQVAFTKSGTKYVPPSWAQATLTHNESGTWTFTRRAKTIFTFSSEGRLTNEKDLNGYTTALTYPSSSETVVTDPAGRTFTFALNGEGHVTTLTEKAGRTVSFKYDVSGNLSEVTDVNGGHTQYTYDSKHHILTIRQPKYYGSEAKEPTPVLTNEYNTSGQVTIQTDQIGRTTHYSYGEGETQVTDPSGNVTADFYTNGLMTTAVRGYGSGDPAATFFYYDPTTLQLAASCDENGHCGIKKYEAHGNVLSETDAMGRTTEHTYDTLNDVTSIKDPLGVTTTMTYDTSGNILTKSLPLLNAKKETIATQKTEYKYGGTEPIYAGDITSTVNPDGKTWQYRYDAYGDLISKTAPPTPENSTGDKTTYGYNTATGWRTSMVSAKGNLSGELLKYTTTYSYDNFGHVISVHDPLWSESKPTLHAQTFHYDANQNLETTSDGNGKTTTYVYDAANELIETQKPDSTTVKQSYWPTGLLKERIDGNGNHTRYGYNALGQMTTETTGLEQTTEYKYDGPGNLLTRVSPEVSCGCTENHYDAANELIEISYPGEGAPKVSKITYDADGHRTGMTDATGTSTLAWDSLGRLTSSKDGYGNEVAYTYDLDNNLQTIVYPGKLTVTRKFDAADRMESLEDWKANKTTYSYDADSNLLTETLPSGTKVTDKLTYDATDHNTAITVAKEATTLAGFSYTRDGAGQVATAATTGLTEASQSYSYTSIEELEKSGPSTEPTKYAYDQAGNITTRAKATTLAYNAGDEPCWYVAKEVTTPSCGTVPTGATSYTYNASGDRTAAKTVTYSYNANNQLIKYNGTATYVYDGNGLRLARTVDSTTEHFVWDHADPTPQLLQDGTNYYIYGPSGLPFEQISKSGTVTYLFHDQIGNTRLLVSTTGANVGSYNYDPYGIPTHSGTTTTPLEYTGQYTDSDSGLVYMRARYYDPATAQFLTSDPLAAVTLAPYTYAGDNPLNNEDPTGLAWQGCVGGTVSLGFFSFGGEVCYVSTPGGSGIAATGSVTAGPGFGANVHAGGGASNACRPSEYGGPFAQAGGSAEGLVGGYGNAFTNAPVPGHGRTVVGATGGVTAGLGVEGGAGGSETIVVPFGGESAGGSCSC
jgi:RHS repeat-associated protein